MREVALFVCCFSSFALCLGAVCLRCFAVAVRGVTMCRKITVAMFDGQVVQSSGFLVQVGHRRKGGSGRAFYFPSPFVCFAGSASGKLHVCGIERLMRLKRDFSPLKFCGPFGCMHTNCVFAALIGCLHDT